MRSSSLRIAEDRPRSRPRSPWAGTWPRRCAALYGLLFFLAAAAAPHHHLNAFEDLISDGPSDSGIVVEQPSSSAGPCVSTRVELDDDPCLACFHHDYASAASYVYVVLRESRSVPLSRFAAAAAFLQSIPDSPASRSPPDSSRLS